jgi:hypothetical protein
MKSNILTAILLAMPFLLKAAGKDDYTLFNPTPRDQMREMSPDRPDLTDGPFTVDAGHLQTETTIFQCGRDGAVKDYNFGETAFRLGLSVNTDLQLIVPFYERETGGDVADNSGIGDLTVRLKWNFWGNDGGDTAFGIIPFVKSPTAGHDLRNNKVEGGVIFPFSVNLSEHVQFATMAEFDVAYDEKRDHYGADFVNTVELAVSCTEKLGSYIEIESVASTRSDAPWEGYASTGITFAATDDIVLDAGVVVGLVAAAQDFAAFTGVSLRF